MELALERANNNDRKNALYVMSNSDKAKARVISNN